MVASSNMTTPDRFDRLRCPKCSASELIMQDGQLSCTSCDAHYLVEDGVAVLVADPDAIETDLAHARDVNPDWCFRNSLPRRRHPGGITSRSGAFTCREF